MNPTVSMLITAYQRPHLLKWNLASLSLQQTPDLEVLVLNDGIPDETASVCASFADRMNIRHIFTGQRNLSGTSHYRVPGFAVNIGARLAKGEILVITCAEMYHVNDTLHHLIPPVLADPDVLSTCTGMDDTGPFLARLESGGSFDLEDYWQNYPRLNTSLPFLMAMRKEVFCEIGGYDEDFTGFAYDDNDLMDRLILSGHRLETTPALTIHLYHVRHDTITSDRTGYLYNQRLYQDRHGIIVRNQDRDWGRLPDE